MMVNGGPQNPLDAPGLLGAGSYALIQTAIATNHRTYAAQMLVFAQTLRGVGAPRATALEARNLLLHLCGTVQQVAQVTNAVALAASLFHGPQRWSYAQVVACVDAFLANPNGKTAVQWGEIGGLLGTDQAVGTAAMARLVGWNQVSVRDLATAFAINPNALSSAEWAQIAREVPVNVHAQATAFARVRGRANSAWNAASARSLAQAYGAHNPNGFTYANWVALAAVLPANAHADAATFARAAHWAWADVLALGSLFGADAYGEAAASWIAMANRIHPRLNWEGLTQRAMRYVELGWPDPITIDAGAGLVQWNLEASADGIVYRATGAQYPHITLHQVNGSPMAWETNPDLHVVTNTPHSPFDHLGRRYTPFLVGRQQAPVRPLAVVNIVNSFCTAMGI